MPNIEIKARYEDISAARKIAENLKAKYVGTDHQVDTYFKTPQGRLKLRESSLSGAQLIPYIRPDQAGPKRSDYLVIAIEDPIACKRLFGSILGIEIVVDKTREIFLIDNIRIHLDRIEGPGNFFEFEAVYKDPGDEEKELRKVENLMTTFRIIPEQLIQGSYREMLLHFNERKK